MDGFDLECMDRKRQRDQRLFGVDLSHPECVGCLGSQATRILGPAYPLDMDSSDVFRFQLGAVAPYVGTRVQVCHQIPDPWPSLASPHLALQLLSESITSFAAVGNSSSDDGHGAAEPGNLRFRELWRSSGEPIKVETLCACALLWPLGV